MTATFRDVEAAIDVWSLKSVIIARDLRGKVELTYAGETARYPYWLAVRKINQVGAEWTP